MRVFFKDTKTKTIPLGVAKASSFFNEEIPVLTLMESIMNQCFGTTQIMTPI